MTNRRELADRLEGVKKEHLRLATWNRGMDRPARVAFHHDAAQALTEAARLLREPVAGEMEALPERATDDMLMAARGLIMSMSFGLPNHKTPLSEVARSGFYGEHWRGILTEDELAMTGPITKGHRADLIWRAMVAAFRRARLDAEGKGGA